MEFWGVEVKAGQPLKVKPTFDNIIHLSQASLGESKKEKGHESKKEKGHESVPLYVKFGDNRLVLGTLIPENIPQVSFDLVFEKEFELSHNWKNGSIHFCGYQTPLHQDSSDEFDMEDSEDEEEVLPAIPAAANGKAGSKGETAKAATPKANAATPKANAAKPAKPIKDVKPEEDDDDESDDEEDDDDEMVDGDDSDEISGEDDGSDDDDDEDDSEDEDSDEEEEAPKKAEVGKKRPTESGPKTPVPAKKAKTPMTDGKKGVHVSTPHPSKGVKTPNAKTQTPNPKSGGQHTCSSCSKTFNSDSALQSHTKAKHSVK